MIKFLLVIPAISVALYGLHRLAVWMERRGWIYYKKSGSSSTATNAFLSIHQLFEPGKKYVLEERVHEADWIDYLQSAAPDPDGADETES